MPVELDDVDGPLVDSFRDAMMPLGSTASMKISLLPLRSRRRRLFHSKHSSTGTKTVEIVIFFSRGGVDQAPTDCSRHDCSLPGSKLDENTTTVSQLTQRRR